MSNESNNLFRYKKTLSSTEAFRQQVIAWSDKYFWDLWWREKHGVPFGSQQHRSMSLQDMLFEFVEEVELLRYEVARLNKQNISDNELAGLSNTKVVKMTQKEVEDEFDNLNIDDYNTELPPVQEVEGDDEMFQLPTG